MTIRDQALVATMVTVAVLGLAACSEGEVGDTTTDVDAAETDQGGSASPGEAPSRAGEERSAPASESYGTPTEVRASATPAEPESGGADSGEPTTEQQTPSATPDPPDSDSKTSSETEDEPDPSPPDDEQDQPSANERHAMAAYQESWDVTFEALDPPRELPKLERLLTGEALAETLDIIEARAERGTRVEGSLDTHPTVVSSSSDEVVLDDCGVENSTEYDSDGEVVDKADEAAYSYRVRVVNDSGSWKAAEINRQQELCEPV